MPEHKGQRVSPLLFVRIPVIDKANGKGFDFKYQGSKGKDLKK